MIDNRLVLVWIRCNASLEVNLILSSLTLRPLERVASLLGNTMRQCISSAAPSAIFLSETLLQTLELNYYSNLTDKLEFQAKLSASIFPNLNSSATVPLKCLSVWVHASGAVCYHYGLSLQWFMHWVTQKGWKKGYLSRGFLWAHIYLHVMLKQERNHLV